MNQAYPKGWHQEYNYFIQQNLTKTLLAKNPPAYWQKFFRALSKAESNHNPTATYTEDFRNGSGTPVVSSGLLQVSLESGRGYGCPFKNQADLLKPLRNLKCGILIMSKWVDAHDKVYGKVDKKWKGGSVYWSVLRNDGRAGHERFLREFSRRFTGTSRY